ncbi:hypothetical protein F5Y14DRAFT_437884 [Nemania sp. NC0429]|nr:hypothetical protein F5Y14DRAFT_437884 [Nemania sp. NC0429]
MDDDAIGLDTFIEREDLLLVRTINMLSHKRKSSSDHRSNTSEFKKPRSNSQQSTLNRIYSCLVISPAGRVISDFQTINKLLAAIRNAIKAHQLLYKTGNILHRNILLNNIIIIKPETAGGFNSMLIDFNLAKIKNSGLSETNHTYRHDLKNGFACGKKPPKESVLRRWEIGSFRDIARNKAGDMTVDGLEGIMTEFPSMFDFVQPLCLRIKKIFFPLDKDERISFRTAAENPD